MDIQRYIELKDAGVIRLSLVKEAPVYEIFTINKSGQEVVIERDALNVDQVKQALNAYNHVVSNFGALLNDIEQLSKISGASEPAEIIRLNAPEHKPSRKKATTEK